MRDEQGEFLRRLGDMVRSSRLDCGLSGTALAERAQVSQPTISRIENGQAVSDAGVVDRVVAALNVDDAARERLSALAKRAYQRTRRRADAGVSMRLGGGAELYRGVSVLRCFQSAAVPVLLQTSDYAVAVAETLPGRPDIFPAAAASGPTWRDDLMRQDGKRFAFVIAEGALRTWPDSPGSMLPQLGRIVEADELTNVRVGVVPWSAAAPVVPLHGFTVYDDTAVTVETFTRELTLTGSEDIAAHVEIFEAFERAAVFGGEMRQFVDKLAADYRELERKLTARP